MSVRVTSRRHSAREGVTSCSSPKIRPIRREMDGGSALPELDRASGQARTYKGSNTPGSQVGVTHPTTL
jgi:hypothetical protein